MSSNKATARSKEQQNAQMVIAKAWSDPSFKSRLLKDANAALASVGIATPPGIKIKVVEDTSTERHYVLPPRPESELHDELLERVVGGVGSANPRGKQ